MKAVPLEDEQQSWRERPRLTTAPAPMEVTDAGYHKLLLGLHDLPMITEDRDL